MASVLRAPGSVPHRRSRPAGGSRRPAEARPVAAGMAEAADEAELGLLECRVCFER